MDVPQRVCDGLDITCVDDHNVGPLCLQPARLSFHRMIYIILWIWISSKLGREAACTLG
jgi:hypothetical protein